MLVPTFVDRGNHVASATDLHGRILGFLDQSRYYFFQAASQLRELVPPELRVKILALSVSLEFLVDVFKI
jgi:hypothetical protein